MKKNPLISVIIPVHGRFEFASQAISSVYKQDTSYLTEIIVVEEKNNKHQVGKKLKKVFPKIKCLVNKFEEGPGGSRQTGLSNCRGEYILFLDSDDQIKPEFFSQLLSSFKSKNTYASICLSQIIFEKNFDLSSKIKIFIPFFLRDIFFHVSYWFNNHKIIPSAFYICQLSHILFKKSAIKNFKFNYDYRYGGEDWDLFIYLFNKGNMEIVYKRLVLFRFSQGSSSYTNITQERKWNSYKQLMKSLPPKLRRGVFYLLFRIYVNSHKK